jgi:glycosyltransferase involved in cell wall biosynthesis
MSADAEPRRSLRLAVYSDASELGGAERSLATLLEWLGPHVEATVLAVNAAVGRAVAGVRPGTGVELLPPVRNKADLRAIAAHLRALRRLRPDILQVNLRWPWSGQYAIAAGLATPGVRVVAVEHAAPLSSRSRIQRRLKRAYSHRLAAHVAVSGRSAGELEALLDLPSGSVRVIPNGAPEADGRPVPPPAAPPLVGSLGRLVPEKGFDLLVRAMASLPGVNVVLVGDGPARPALELLAAELGVGDRLVITGWRDDARGYLQGLDLFVLPSYFEGFGLAALEAMLAGRAVVATDVGGLGELVVPEVTGLLVRPGDAEALAGAIRSLLDDPATRERMGAEGRALARERYSPEAMARRFEVLYDEVT